MRVDDLKKAGIDYILIDPALRNAIGKSNAEGLTELGAIVFSNYDVQLVRVD